jgi:hypothetical protein
MFRTISVSIIRSFFTVHTAMVYVIQILLTYTIAVCTVKNSWWWTENCPKYVEFYSKNKFEKLVHLVRFIIRIYHEARSPERQFITMHGHLNVKLSLCTVTWTSNYHDARSPERQIITMHGHLKVKSLRNCKLFPPVIDVKPLTTTRTFPFSLFLSSSYFLNPTQCKQLCVIPCVTLVCSYQFSKHSDDSNKVELWR